MFERSVSAEAAIQVIKRAGSPTGVLRTRSMRLGRARTRLTIAGVALFDLLGDAALTGSFTPVLVAALRIPRRATQGAWL